MYTFEEAVGQYKKTLPWGLKAWYDNNCYADKHPFYCPKCGWYYPHDNWYKHKLYCPRCHNKGIIQANNESVTQLGLFS